MMHSLPLIPLFPFAGFIILAFFGRRMSKLWIAVVGAGSVGLSACLTVILGIHFLIVPPADNAYTQTVWQWMRVGAFAPQIAFHLDAFSLVMTFVITFVSFLIHVYSSEFMEEDSDYKRFFAYMNLFVGSMVILVLADNLLLLYLGWEGVGLCSYLLIGFWYKDPANASAAVKAFIVTRVGDAAMTIALIIIFLQLGTLDLSTLSTVAASRWPVGSGIATVTALLLLAGAVGKSAQLPLQTWLPDAMAGPTPVSALIHSSTMVTAGVYLIARTNGLFSLSPVAQTTVAIVGAVTLLLAGFSALVQHDIKRILAYSTISQIGYMFLALGVGAYSAAMFHFMTHAFFKALLFLGAGVVIHCLHDEHDIFRMGGLRKLMPVTFWTFLIAGASLSALPLVTAGFYSKDLIIWRAWSSESGNGWLWGAGVVGAFITALYTFRMIFVVFFGEIKVRPNKAPRFRMAMPLVVLAVLSIIVGMVETPEAIGHVTLFSNLMGTVVRDVATRDVTISTELFFQIVTTAVVLAGIVGAYFFYLRKPAIVDALTRDRAIGGLKRLWFSGWGFDWVYNKMIIVPYEWIARTNRTDVVDLVYQGIAAGTNRCNALIAKTQTGRVRNYAEGIALGAAILVAVAVLL